jgi:hypothetical protein
MEARILTCYRPLEVVRGRDRPSRARGRLRLVDDGLRRARVQLHRRRQRHGLVADHLARRQVHEVGVNGAAWSAGGAVELQLRGLTVGRALTRRRVVLRRTKGGLAGLAAEVVLKVYQIALDVRDGGAADDAELHAALAAVFELDGVQVVRQRTGALVKVLLVGACIVAEAVGTHILIICGIWCFCFFTEEKRIRYIPKHDIYFGAVFTALFWHKRRRSLVFADKSDGLHRPGSIETFLRRRNRLAPDPLARGVPASHPIRPV